MHCGAKPREETYFCWHWKCCKWYHHHPPAEKVNCHMGALPINIIKPKCKHLFHANPTLKTFFYGFPCLYFAHHKSIVNVVCTHKLPSESRFGNCPSIQIHHYTFRWKKKTKKQNEIKNLKTNLSVSRVHPKCHSIV